MGLSARRRWIEEQKERVQRQLDDLERNNISPEAVAELRRRLKGRLQSASAEDNRFVLEALETRVVAQTDGSWELEVQVPREEPELMHCELQTRVELPLKHRIRVALAA